MVDLLRTSREADGPTSGHSNRFSAVDGSWSVTDWVCDYDLEKNKLKVPAGFQKHNAKAVVNTGKE